MPPCTTIRRITTTLKTKNNQNCQKVELYGSPTTKDLKKKYSSRWVEGWSQGPRAERIWYGSDEAAAVAAGELGSPTSGRYILGGTPGE